MLLWQKNQKLLFLGKKYFLNREKTKSFLDFGQKCSDWFLFQIMMLIILVYKKLKKQLIGSIYQFYSRSKHCRYFRRNFYRRSSSYRNAIAKIVWTDLGIKTHKIYPQKCIKNTQFGVFILMLFSCTT